MLSYLAKFLVASLSLAYATGDPPMLTMQALGAVMSRSVLTFPLHEGGMQSKLVLSRVTNNSVDSSCANCNNSAASFSNDMSGNGFTAALTYGISNHWGASFLAGYSNIAGTRTLSFRDNSGKLIITPPTKVNPVTNNGNNGINGASGQGRGYIATANAIWDSWEGDAFRLPFYLGAGVISIDEKADDINYGVKRTAKVMSPAYLFGVAPSVSIWDFRVVGYFMMAGAFSPGTGSIVDYNPQSGDVNSQTDFALVGGTDAATPIAGIEFTYQPWGTGFTYAPDITHEGAQSFGFQWVHEWGATGK